MQKSVESTRIDTFYQGLEVDYHNPISGYKTYGLVNFICETYITLLVRRGEHRSADVNVVISNDKWKYVHPINSKREQ